MKTLCYDVPLRPRGLRLYDIALRGILSYDLYFFILCDNHAVVRFSSFSSNWRKRTKNSSNVSCNNCTSSSNVAVGGKMPSCISSSFHDAQGVAAAQEDDISEKVRDKPKKGNDIIVTIILLGQACATWQQLSCTHVH